MTLPAASPPLTAENVLASYQASSLQQMARERRIEPKGKTKDELVRLIAPTLFDSAEIARAYGELVPVERQVVDELVLLGGSAPTSLIRRRLEAEGLVDTQARAQSWHTAANRGSPSQRGSRKFADVVARIGVVGLVFTTNGPSGGMVELSEPGGGLYVPTLILRHLPRVELPLETTDEPPQVTPADPAAFVRDLTSLMSFVDREPLGLIARGALAKRYLARLDEQFQVHEAVARARSEDDLPRLSLLRALGEDLKLIAQRLATLALGDRAESFLKQPVEPRRATLLAAYRQTPGWCEIFRLPSNPTVRGVSGRQAPPLVVSARQRIIAEIAGLPAGQWVGLAQLRARLKRIAYDFLFPRFDSPPDSGYYPPSETTPYYGANQLGWTFEVSRNADVAWDQIEGGMIAVVVQTLGQLGILDLGYADGALAALRVTPEGSRLLQGEPLPSQPAEPNVVIQPNFQIFAFAPTPDNVLFTLDRLADRVRTDQAIEYRLSRESIFRAEKHGLGVGDALGFLERISALPLPQNVRKSIEDWGALRDRVVVRRGSALLHVADPATLDALFADPTVSPLLGRRVAPTAALVPFAQLRPLHLRLLENSFVPALAEEEEVPPDPAYRVTPAGDILFRQRLPNIFVLGTLRAFVETTDGVTRLTLASLRQAARAGLTAEQVRTALERYHDGPLPAEVGELITRWTKDWGEGALAEVTLLQVETADVLASVFADPELRGQLQPIPGAPTLAIVRAEFVEAVRRVLTARGMELRDTLRW
jgi:Helicase conserved C-terminal domain